MAESNITSLSPSEMRLIQAYRKLDEEVQDYFVQHAESCAENDKLKRPTPKKPAFRLIDCGRLQ